MVNYLGTQYSEKWNNFKYILQITDFTLTRVWLGSNEYYLGTDDIDDIGSLIGTYMDVCNTFRVIHKGKVVRHYFAVRDKDDKPCIHKINKLKERKGKCLCTK